MIVCQRSSTRAWSTGFSTLPRTLLTQETQTSPSWHHALACRPRPRCVQYKHTPVGIHLVESYNLLGRMFHMIFISTQLIPRRLLPPSGSSELSSRNIRTGNSRVQFYHSVYHSLIIRRMRSKMESKGAKSWKPDGIWRLGREDAAKGPGPLENVTEHSPR